MSQFKNQNVKLMRKMYTMVQPTALTAGKHLHGLTKHDSDLVLYMLCEHTLSSKPQTLFQQKCTGYGEICRHNLVAHSDYEPPAQIRIAFF